MSSVSVKALALLLVRSLALANVLVFHLFKQLTLVSPFYLLATRWRYRSFITLCIDILVMNIHFNYEITIGKRHSTKEIMICTLDVGQVVDLITHSTFKFTVLSSTRLVSVLIYLL